ncbi:hypothetical protein ACWCQS_33615 [Streptomyces sp. NPDC002076]
MLTALGGSSGGTPGGGITSGTVYTLSDVAAGRVLDEPAAWCAYPAALTRLIHGDRDQVRSTGA